MVSLLGGRVLGVASAPLIGGRILNITLAEVMGDVAPIQAVATSPAVAALVAVVGIVLDLEVLAASAIALVVL